MATLLTTDGLRHLVKSEYNRGFNGWSYYFECGSDIGYKARGIATEEAPTCVICASTTKPACP